MEAREETRAKKVDAGLSKMRLEYANAATAYDVVTPTLLELQHLVEDMQKSKHGAVGKAQAAAEEVYDAVVVAWRLVKYACPKSSKDKGAVCQCGIKCKKPIHTAWSRELPAGQGAGKPTGRRKKAKKNAAAAAPALGHMWEHALELARLIDIGTIKRPSKPLPKPPPRRGYGDLQIGTLTDEAKRMDKERQEMARTYMQPAVDDPRPYTKIVHRPLLNVPSMLQQKVEVTFNITDDDDDVEDYLHVFEGTITGFYDSAAAVKKVTGYETRSRKPLALVRWDKEHDSEDSYVLLDEDVYAKESTVGGWVVLGTEYLRHCDGRRAVRVAEQAAAALALADAQIDI